MKHALPSISPNSTCITSHQVPGQEPSNAAIYIYEPGRWVYLCESMEAPQASALGVHSRCDAKMIVEDASASARVSELCMKPHARASPYNIPIVKLR